MKYLQFTLLFLTLSISTQIAQAQQLSISAYSEHSGYTQNQFPLAGGYVSSDRGYYTVADEGFFNPAAWAISPGGALASFLESSRGELMLKRVDGRGNLLKEAVLEFFNSEDETLHVYPFDDGRVVTRDNVANFTFFDPAGRVLYSISNSSQSSEGERESQLASDRNGRTIVLYNPVINYGSSRGSQARVVFGEEDHHLFFNDREEEIREVRVTSTGAFISILTNAGSAYLYDRFGNEVRQFDFEDDLSGLNLSAEGDYLTAYTRGRVQVYNVLTGERIGSTSSRSPVLFADYIAEDDTIIILGGDIQDKNITDPMVTAVHISRRQIVREEANQSLSWMGREKLSLNRDGVGDYRIDGLNRSLVIRASF
jgi:hypothetical protein